MVGLQVTYGTVSPCHAEALDEQLCREEESKVQSTAEDIQESSDHNVVNESHKKIAINIANFGGDV